MNDLTDLQQAVLAYFLAGAANDINIAGRWYPKSEVILIIDDKFQQAVRKFGMKARSATKPAATAFVEDMIAKGGWATKENEFGGTMQQWQMDVFRKELRELQAANPLVQGAASGGETYWADVFAPLTA
ncbi:MAG: hypothetical protein QM676_15040 [Novosphingobium sp.]